MKVTVLGAALIVLAVIAVILLLRHFDGERNQTNTQKG